MSLACVSITASTAEAAAAEIEQARQQKADIVELRLDFLDDGEDWEPIVRNKEIDMIVTNRAEWEGGKSKESEDARLKKLCRADQLGAELIDVELKAASAFKEIRTSPGSAKLILSHHDFEKTPSQDELSKLHGDMLQAGADVCKIAVTANDISDCIPVFELLLAAQSPTIALAMTERGLISRLLASKYGSFLTFCTIGSGKESAPGQPTLSNLLNLFRFRTVEHNTDVYGIIGKPVSHSMSPAIHNAAFRKRRVNAVYVPLLIDDIEDFLRKFRQYNFKGFSITIPHKEGALRCVDIVDDVAKNIGAINTIVRQKDGKLKGYNTDWMAAIGAVERALIAKEKGSSKEEEKPLRFREEEGEELRPLKGKHVILLGAGGAARGMAFGAVERGAEALTIVNRTVERANKLAQEMAAFNSSCKCTGISPQDLRNGAAGTFHVVMNSTSVGMHPNEGDTPVDKDLLNDSVVVFDAVYNPRETRLLSEAKSVGCTTVDGVEMFVGQALKQYELWTQTPPPRDVMEEAVLRGLKIAK